MEQINPDNLNKDQLSALNPVVFDVFLGSIKHPNEYNTKQYHKKFIEKNADKLKEKTICSVCCGSYTYFNKSKHIKSKRHINLLDKYKGLVKFD
jgi:hypothetical protein